MKKAIQELGWSKQGLTLHTLRHTFATELMEAQIDLPSIQRILGHTSLSITAIYLHVRRTHLAAASAVMNLIPLNPFATSAYVRSEGPSPQ